MKGRRSKGYKNYGPIPQNEYTATTPEKSEDTRAVFGYDSKPSDTAYKQRLVKRQALHPSGRRKVYGWVRSWKANGWRAEAVSMQEELTEMEF